MISVESKKGLILEFKKWLANCNSNEYIIMRGNSNKFTIEKLQGYQNLQHKYIEANRK